MLWRAVVRYAVLVLGACSSVLTWLPGTRDAAPRRNVILALSYAVGLLILGEVVRRMLA
jgi:hypothetical protein